MSTPVSKLRLFLLRALYFISFISLAPSTWAMLFNEGAELDPMNGIALSFWAAIALLMVIGLFKPLKMLPLVLLQFCYKSTWMATVGLPLWLAGSVDPTAQELLMACGIGALLDLFIIPWRYVLHEYFRPERSRLSVGDEEAVS